MPRFEVQANYSPYPQSQTGACVLCGAGLRDDFENSGRRERVVSTGTRRGFADRRGETEEEFCESCAVCIGRAVGMVQPAEVDAARLDVARFRAQRDQALAEAEDLRTAVAALERAGWRAPDGDASTAPEGVGGAEGVDLETPVLTYEMSGSLATQDLSGEWSSRPVDAAALPAGHMDDETAVAVWEATRRTCPDCGAVCKNELGLATHRGRKHPAPA